MPLTYEIHTNKTRQGVRGVIVSHGHWLVPKDLAHADVHGALPAELTLLSACHTGQEQNALQDSRLGASEKSAACRER